MEQGKNFEDKLTQQLKRATDQLVAAQARGGVELEERLAAMLREHLYHYPVADEAVARIVVTLNALPEWLRTGLAYGGHVDQLVAVAAGVFALGNGAGRWMLVDLNTGLVSVELWPTAAEAADAAAGVLSLPVCAEQYGDRTISWSEPVGDDEPADDEYELATCIGCGCDDMHACWVEAAGSPCSWLRVDREAGLGVCSACPDDVARWEAGDREIAVPVAVRELEQGV